MKDVFRELPASILPSALNCDPRYCELGSASCSRPVAVG